MFLALCAVLLVLVSVLGTILILRDEIALSINLRL